MLDRIVIDDAVYALRPDFAALVLTAEGLRNGAPRPRTATPEVEEADAHVAAWREAYRAFGVNPKRARPSVDALLRRPELPQINLVVDAYNAISVRYALPVGGEDMDAYRGPARLVRADGDEPFETVRDGQAVVEHPDAGEVVWRDDAGVTCRRWNWRQCGRTHITERTKNALFVLERLAPYPVELLEAAGQELAAELREISPGVVVGTRLIAP
jgi:DNA/RNA-binding domain of Phe-tRNA-synthetase-like protein